MGSAASALKKQKYSVDDGSAAKQHQNQERTDGAENSEGQPTRTQVGKASEPEPEPEPAPLPEPLPEPDDQDDEPWEPLETGALERRSGWMDVEIPPLEKDLDPEWETYWFVLLDTKLQVFEIDPADNQKRGKSKPPKYVYPLNECVIERLPREALPEGRGYTFLLRKRGEGEEEAREALIEDAFRPGNTQKDKKSASKSKDKNQVAKTESTTAGPESGSAPGERRRKKRRRRPDKQDGSKAPKQDVKAAKQAARETTKQSKAAAAEAKAREKKKDKTDKAKAKAKELMQKKIDAGEEIVVDVPEELKIDPGSSSEYMWWCRAMYEGSAQVPDLVEKRLRRMYKDEEQQRAHVSRTVWRNHLVRMSRYVPRCVLQMHIDEGDVASFKEPKIEIFDAALAQVELTGFSKLGSKPRERQKHAALFTKILGCLSAHGGDVISMTGKSLVVMWGRHRPARERVDLLKIDVLRACQCMVALRVECADLLGHGGGGSVKMRFGVSAGAVSALWVGTYEKHRSSRQFMLKGTPMVLLRKALTATAEWGEILMTANAHRLSQKGVDAEFDSSIQAAVLRNIKAEKEDGNATAVVPLEPLTAATENKRMTKQIAEKQERREKMIAELYKIEREDTGFEEMEDPKTGQKHYVFDGKIDNLKKIDPLKKKIERFRSLTKQHFYEEVIAFLEAQPLAEIDLINKYKKALRFLKDDMSDEKITAFRSKHWENWESWKEEVIEADEERRRAAKAIVESARSAIGSRDGAVSVDSMPSRGVTTPNNFVPSRPVTAELASTQSESNGNAVPNSDETDGIEPEEREIYDQGMRELILQETVEQIVALDDKINELDQEHHEWQLPVLDVLSEYIPSYAKPYVRGRQDARKRQVSVVCVSLPEHDFDWHGNEAEKDLRENGVLHSSLIQLQHVVSFLQRLAADHFDADIREVISTQQTSIITLTLGQLHHAKKALAAALAVRDFLCHMRLRPTVAVTTGEVFDTLVGDHQGTRCQLASTGAIVDTAVTLLSSAAKLPSSLRGVVCDDATRDGAIASEAALGEQSECFWCMRLVYDTVGFVETQDGKRVRAYAPRRFDEWAGKYLLRCRSVPFHPHNPSDVVGRGADVSRILEVLGTDEPNNRVLVEAPTGAGKTSLAAAIYRGLYQRGYTCLAGKAVKRKQDIPFSALCDVISAAIVCAARPDQTPEFVDSAANSAKMLSIETMSLPWWLRGGQCMDSCVTLDDATASLPKDLQNMFPLIAIMLPFLEIPETDDTQKLDGKTRLSETNNCVLKLLQHVMAQTKRGLCIMIDDAQWLDSSSQVLIRLIMRKLPEVSWYLNCSLEHKDSRFCAALRKNPKVSCVDLNPLDADSTYALAERVCRRIAEQRFANFAATQATGNHEVELDEGARKYLGCLTGTPLHTIHFTRSLFETEDLIVSNQGQIMLAPMPEQETSGQIPQDVKEIIRSRIHALPDECKALLLLPSVLADECFTDTFAVELAERHDAWDESIPMVCHLQAFQRLCDDNFLVRSEVHADSLMFSSTVVRDLAYECLSVGLLKNLHKEMVAHAEEMRDKSRTSLPEEMGKKDWFQPTDGPFASKQDTEKIVELSMALGEHDLQHKAWTTLTEGNIGDLQPGCRLHIRNKTFAEIVEIHRTGRSLDILFDNTDEVQKISLENSLQAKVFERSRTVAHVNQAIEMAQPTAQPSVYKTSDEKSAYCQIIVAEQLCYLSLFSNPIEAQEVVIATVANLYTCIVDSRDGMAHAGALVEAAAAVTQTLALFEYLPDRDDQDRKEQELELLGIFHRNWLAEEVSTLFEGVKPVHIERMRVLSDDLKIVEYEIPILVCEWMMQYYAQKRSLHTCIRLARSFISPDTKPAHDIVLEANRMLYMVHADKGEWRETIRLCNCVVRLDGARHDSLYDKEKHHESTYRYAGTDPGAFAWNVLAIAYLKVGEFDKSLLCTERAYELACTLEHPLTLALTYSSRLSVLYELKQWDSIYSLAPEVKEFCVEQGQKRLTLPIRCAFAESNPLLIRDVYEEVICTAKELREKESWATNQSYIAPMLRICQLAGEYGKGLALAVEMWTESEMAVGRFHAETWCAWLPEIYMYIGQFKLMQAEQEEMLGMTVEERAAWREEVWAEGLKFLAQSVVASRLSEAIYSELRGLITLYKALVATKIKGALKPREWMNDLDPTILNQNLVGERMREMYLNLDGDEWVDRMPDIKDAQKLLERIDSEKNAAGKSKFRLKQLKLASQQGVEAERQARDAENAQQKRKRDLWSKGRDAATAKAIEQELQGLQDHLEQLLVLEATLKSKYMDLKDKCEDRENRCRIDGWVHREKEKFGDFVAAYASLEAGVLTWLKAGDREKPSGSAQLLNCTIAPVEKRRRKQPSAFEVKLSAPDSNGAEKYVMVPKDEDSVDAWVECFQRNCVYSEIEVLQAEVAAAHDAFRNAKKEARQAKEKLQERRSTAIARSIVSKQRLAKELAHVPEPEPEPEPEKKVLDGPAVARQVTINGADGLLQADTVGASDPCVTWPPFNLCTMLILHLAGLLLRYAVVWWNEVEIGRTEVIRDTLDPRYESSTLC